MKRIIDHPILGAQPQGNKVTFLFEGKPIEGIEGEPVAAALSAAGVFDLRYSSKNNQPRGLFCGIGQCQECAMVVDGVPNVRTCVTPLKVGMRVERQRGLGTINE